MTNTGVCPGPIPAILVCFQIAIDDKRRWAHVLARRVSAEISICQLPVTDCDVAEACSSNAASLNAVFTSTRRQDSTCRIARKLKKQVTTMANNTNPSNDNIPVDTIWLDDGEKLEEVRPYQMYVFRWCRAIRLVNYILFV